MPQHNPNVDIYISKSSEFAKPILNHLRDIIHEACPGVEEVIKWGIPHFDYKGDMMCILAAYKKHCSFSFWKAELMTNPKLKEGIKPGQKMGNMDKIKSLSDLPAKKVLIAYVKEAMILNEKGVKKTALKSSKTKIVEVPDYFIARLAQNPKAKGIFESKSESFRKDYVIWITGAKTNETRENRVRQSLEWIAQEKGRFWQYEM